MMSKLDCVHALCPICEEELCATTKKGHMGMLELISIYCTFCGYIVPDDE